MVDNAPINQPSNNSPIQPTGPITPGSGARVDSTQRKGGPAFQALLDKLQEQARSLSADSEKVDKAEDLSGAVDRAKSTLTDALSLSDQLLEAYRQASTAPKEEPGGGDTA